MQASPAYYCWRIALRLLSFDQQLSEDAPMTASNPMLRSRYRHRCARPTLETLECRTLLSSTTGTLPVHLVSATGAFSSSDILVQFKSSTPHAVLSGTSIGQGFPLVPKLYEINLSPRISVSRALAAYRASGKVVFAQPDYTLHSTSVASNSNVAQQWALQAIDAQDAWSVTEGSPSIIVAVDDTGIDYDNPDLYLNIWINQAAIPASRLANLVDVDHNGYISMADLNNPINQGPGKIEDLNGDGRIDAGDLLQPMILNAQGQDTGLGGWVNPNAVDSADGLVGDLIGWNFYGNNNNPYDYNSHGTHVAGIIAGMGTNGGTIGVAPDVQIMPNQFLDSNGNGSISDFIDGLDYSVAHGAKISNNSWTGADPSTALTDAINYAQAAGMIFVAAAGNNGTNNDVAPVYPANLTENNVVAVAATDQYNNLASFSNYGAHTVTLAAPGVNILSTLPGGTYGNKSGTSMATPIVSGVMALVWSIHPSWTYLQVINQVESTVTKVASLTGKVATGGIVNAAAAVGASISSLPTSVVSSNASGPTANSLSTITLTFSSALNPSTFTAADLGLLSSAGHIAITGVAPVAGSNNTTFTITFATQTAAGTYTLYIGANARDVLGQPIAASQAQFKISASTTATAPPTATSVVSSSGSGPTPSSLSSIQVTFNEGIQPSTFNSADLGLLGPGGARIAITSVTAVPGTSNCTYTIAFATQTTPGTYTLYVGTQALDLYGNPISAWSGQFKITAGAAPTLLVSATGSGSSANTLSSIQVTFNQGVNPSSFTAADLGLLGSAGRITITGVTAVAGTNNQTFTITFATQTAPGSYTLYIGANAMDVFGNPIVAAQAQFKIAAS
jgi:subtilisin family serine protease